MGIDTFVRAGVFTAWLVAAAAPQDVALLGAQEPAPPAWPEFVRAFDAYVDAGGIVGASAVAMRPRAPGSAGRSPRS